MRLIVRCDMTTAYEEIDKHQRTVGFEQAGVHFCLDLLEREKLELHEHEFTRATAHGLELPRKIRPPRQGVLA